MTGSSIKRVPPQPDLWKKIYRSKKAMVLKGPKALPSKSTDEYLDEATLNAILSRSPESRTHTLFRLSREASKVVGNRKALVLLVDFSDNAGKESKKHFEDMLFSSGSYATGSLRDYYWEASYHKLNITGDVAGAGGVTAGWFRAPKPYSYYADNNYGIDGAYPKNAQKLVEDVVDLAAPYINFADYDNDGDGYVDALFVVHAGLGAEETGKKTDIWSHQWGINPRTVDGVKVSSYSMEPENGNIGVFCHELGHVFGLPDLYDYGYDSAGVGYWDIMAAGSWNNGGKTPAHFSSWCKIKLGWVTPTTIFNAQQDITLKPYVSNEQVFKLPIGSTSSKEYFLLENRKKTLFDSYLPGEGLIISHVDENKTDNNDQTHYLVDIEQCDGSFHLNNGSNSGDPNDPFPCTGKDSFTVSTLPSSKSYSGADSKVAVSGIQRSGNDILAKINAGSGGTDTGPVWYSNKSVQMTFAHCATQWVWAYISGLGWRRIKDGSPDGTTNLFVLCCEALANGKIVSVNADADFIYTMYLQ